MIINKNKNVSERFDWLREDAFLFNRIRVKT